MLTVNPSSLRTTFGGSADNPTGGSPLDAPADPAGFASLLRHTQMPSAPMPEPVSTPASTSPSGTGAPTEPAHPTEAAADTPAPQESDNAQRARTLKGKPHDAKANPETRETRDTRDAKAPPAADTAEAADGKAAGSRPTAGTAPIDPNVMQWLAALQRAAAGQGAEAAPAADGQAAPAATDTDVIQARSAAKGSLAADLKADAELKDNLAQGQSAVTEALGTGTFAAALGARKDLVEKPRDRAVEGPRAVAEAGASAVATTPGAGTGVAAPAAVAIAAPVTAPEFAQELGLRMSTLAKDGVHTAELHLNPADMGPVSVQIVMDGTQARVDFGADMAATRQAIEAGLPELASALADAGFTLAGGGVSQHAGGRGGGNEPGPSGGGGPRRIATPDTVSRVAGAARRLVTKGGVDLFA